jgi:enhancing lycopene biosynthesis protein 2
MAKVGVVLSGCGVFDGAEIHESVITLLALDRAGVEVVMAAPDVELDEVDHLRGEPTGKKRNVLVESARIARGEIIPLRQLAAADIDAVIFPGGFGAAKNLCDFASKGGEAVPNEDAAALLRDIHAAGKPIAAVCIAPAMVAAALGKTLGPKLTIGNDEAAASGIEALGATHVNCPVKEFVVDEENRIVSTPAYMLGQNISEVAEGIEKTVAALLNMLED